MGRELHPLLDAIGPDDDLPEDLLDGPPRVGEVAIGRGEPADLAAVDGSVDRELGPEVGLPESSTALEDVEACGVLEDGELPGVEGVLDRFDLESHVSRTAVSPVRFSHRRTMTSHHSGSSSIA